MAHIKSYHEYRHLITVSLGFDGKRRLKYHETFHGTESQARKRGRELDALKVLNQLRPNTGYTVAQWSEEWLDILARRKRSPSTIHNYRKTLQNRILPAFGKMAIESLQPQHIIDWLDNIAESGEGIRFDGKGDQISGATQLRAYNALSGMLQEAVYRQVLSVNPARSVRPPRAEKREMQAYPPEVISLMVQALAGEPPRTRALIMLAIGTGLRRGELAALEWTDIDWQTLTLHVKRAVVNVPGRPRILKGTKTEQGLRPVGLPGLTAKALLDWYGEQLECAATVMGLDTRMHRRAPRRPHDTTHIFTSQRGQWMHADSVSDLWESFVKRHGLPHIGLHGLRHTYATRLHAAGLALADISAALRHANRSTTLIYTHATSHQHAASDAINRDLSTPLSTNQQTNATDLSVKPPKPPPPFNP